MKLKMIFNFDAREDYLYWEDLCQGVLPGFSQI